MNTSGFDPASEIRKTMENVEFDSTDETRDFADSFVGALNTKAVDDFQGLSPTQMSRFLYHPFDSPELAEFRDVLPSEPQCMLTIMVRILADAAGEKGIKATANGNLPRAVCREAVRIQLENETPLWPDSPDEVYKEDDAIGIQKTRFIMQDAGLLHFRKGRFHLTQRFRHLYDSDGMAAVYPLLLKAFTLTTAWGYWDRYLGLEIIQHSFLFSLRMLFRAGNAVHPNSYYEDAFLRAYPMATREIGESPWRSPEDIVRSCYSLRFLQRFAEFFGLVKLESASDDRFRTAYDVTVLPLLRDTVRFHV